MATSYSPNTATDGLVFYYDTFNTLKSYKGRPTTNYGPASFGDWGTENTAERISTGNTYKGQPTYNCRTTLGASWQGIDNTIAGLRTAAGASGTVTMSCMVRNNNPTAYPMYAYIGHDFSSTRTIAANSGWQKVQWTVNQSSMNNDYVEFRPYTNNASIYLEMTMPMVEVNVTYASQFVEGTRSATEGLVDLMGNSTIDLTNVSFDSNAQMTFDGSDDRAILGTVPLAAGASTYTIEAVFKADSTKTQVIWEQNSSEVVQHQRACMILLSNGYGGFNGQANDYHSAIPYSTGVWYHWIITIDKNASTNPIKIYVNGDLYAQGNSSSGASNLNVGTHGAAVGYKLNSNNEYFDGNIKLVKVYNRVLTASEAKSNFNAIKGRYGL